MPQPCLGSEFGGRRGIAAGSVRIVFTDAAGLLRDGPDLVGRLAGLLTYTRRVNKNRTAADLSVVFQVEDELERAEFEAALASGG